MGNIKLKEVMNNNLNELASFKVEDLVPDAIPSKHRQNKELHQDLAKALNVIFKKYDIHITVK